MNKFSNANNLDNHQWSYNLNRDTKNIGLYWTSINQILDNINSEVIEIREAITNNESKARICEEIGDLYLGVLELCHYQELNPDLILGNSLKKFEKRIKLVKEAMKKRGIDHFDPSSINVARELWNEAKEKENGAAEED